MQYIEIPQTDIKTSNICLGTAGFGTIINRQESFILLDAYFSEGGNFLDTARVYGDWHNKRLGIRENLLGQWIKKRKNRDKLILATKGGHPNPWRKYGSRLSRREIIFDLDKSLTTLGVDVIDLYWLHRDDINCSIDEVVDTLVDQVKAGKIRYFGCSNWRLERIKAAREYASQKKVLGFVANQMMWSLAHVGQDVLEGKNTVLMDNDLKQYHDDTGFVAVPYTSQAKGLFQKMENGPSSYINVQLNLMYSDDLNRCRFRHLKQIAKQRGLSITEIVLGYLLSQPFPVIPIIGSRSVQQLQDSMRGGDVKLLQEEIQFLENCE